MAPNELIIQPAYQHICDKLSYLLFYTSSCLQSFVSQLHYWAEDGWGGGISQCIPIVVHRSQTFSKLL